jgi:hypothetical protein
MKRAFILFIIIFLYFYYFLHSDNRDNKQVNFYIYFKNLLIKKNLDPDFIVSNYSYFYYVNKFPKYYSDNDVLFQIHNDIINNINSDLSKYILLGKIVLNKPAYSDCKSYIQSIENSLANNDISYKFNESAYEILTYNNECLLLFLKK